LEQNMTIDRRLSVNQLIQQHPAVLSFLTAAGVDTCCGGDLSLEEAARRAGVDLDNLVVRLETEAGGRTGGAVGRKPSACSCGCADT